MKYLRFSFSALWLSCFFLGAMLSVESVLKGDLVAQSLAQTSAQTQVVGNKTELLAALSQASGGEVIVLEDGDYGAVTVENVFASPVTLKAQNQAGPRFSYLRLEDAQNIVIDGVYIFLAEGQPYGLHLVDSSFITFKNSQIYAEDFNSGKNLFLNGVNDVYIQGNNISSTNDAVHTNGGLENVVFEGNTMKIRPEVVPVGAHFDVFQFRSSRVQNLKIINNYLGYSTQNIFLQNIGAGPWENMVIKGNVSITEGDGGFAGKHVALGAVNNLVFEGNTLAHYTTDGLGYAHGLSASVSGDFVVRNNIFSNALYLSKGNDSDYNLFYTTNKTITGAPGQDANSIVADPEFVDLANGQLELQSTSPAINVGVEVEGITTDWYGNKRPQSAWDIGGAEYRSEVFPSLANPGSLHRTYTLIEEGVKLTLVTSEAGLVHQLHIWDAEAQFRDNTLLALTKINTNSGVELKFLGKTEAAVTLLQSLFWALEF